jgi:hypothetical protein
MNFKKVVGTSALIGVLALGFSCSQETTSETDDLYGIERDEIKEGDT